jgi:glucose-1-phosphate thymidylyltransferase
MKRNISVAGKRARMEAVVLAGGYATRLWPLTRHRPKMLLPVGEATVVDRILAPLEADDRIETVYVSTNERFAEDFATHLETTAFEKPELSVEETTEEGEKLGVVGALAQLVERESVDDDLLVVAGDNLISFDLSSFLDFFTAHEGSTLAAYDVGSPERATAYGIVELDGDRVVDFQEKPDEPPSTLASIACYGFTAGDIRFEEYLDGGNNPDEPGWFLQWLQARRPVHAFCFDEAWFDIGTPENYLRAVRWALDGDTVVADSATVDGSTLGENVHVMAGATVRDSTVEGSLVFPDATVEETDLHDTIIDHEAVVRDLALSGALVGAHSQLP